MENNSKFCTCTNYQCPLHPTKHDQGCTPCISKNLKLKEIPNCFFNQVAMAENRALTTSVEQCFCTHTLSKAAISSNIS